jgi:hypothetical protein
MLSFHKVLQHPIDVRTLRTMIKQLSPFEAELWAGLSACLQSYANRSPGSDWFGTLFEALVPLRRRNDGYSAIEILDEPLRALWVMLSKDEKKRVEQRLTAQPRTNAAWQSWQHQYGWWANLKRGRLF